ncbi:3-dehydroquinate synthase [Candidatus Ornithobacterium hominis]|uniref:3-dehydroquinate synthase n=1 Tax=Candidatus Ornithobacterium hominis TaxID=2497989 RepID=UPI0024BD2B0E|nr:3-dehydroquinate synthase [Candidatus Ornithobacterium hominis]CAI9430004.1 3-dehydroquinate synthase [Candidatus Ornithobacterium hominis]
MKQSFIYFEDIFTTLNDFIKDYKGKITFLVDENTQIHCLPLVLERCKDLDAATFLEIPAGESAKQIGNVADVWGGMLDLNLDRNSLLINLGGGVVTDLGGFAASTFKRGITFINIPTSLLAMADASVGGKTGIDFKGLKNQIGTFSLPEMVLISPEFLETLPQNQLNSGFAEMLKHGLIRDKKHWQNLVALKSLTPDNVAPYIQSSVEIKRKVVAEDPKEKGLRKILNAGHTLGHAIETYFLNQNIDAYLNHLINGEEELLHGEAVAIGLILEAYISAEKNKLSSEELEEISKGLLKFFPKRNLPTYAEIKNYLLQDKKNENGEIQFMLLDKIGECDSQSIAAEKEVIEAAFQYYSNLKVH